VRENAGPDCLIWEAARATTATPTFFKPIAIAAALGHTPQAFVDGALRCNNPMREVMDEACAVFGSAARLGCLVSVGTGHAAVIGLPKQPDAFERLLPVGLIKALKSVATDCEKEAQSMARQFREPLDRYFRFSVAHGASGILLEEWERLDEVTQHTEAYLKDTEVSRAVNRLVKLLCQPGQAAEGNSQITLDNLCTSWRCGTSSCRIICLYLGLRISIRRQCYADSAKPCQSHQLVPSCCKFTFQGAPCNPRAAERVLHAAQERQTSATRIPPARHGRGW
jgi:hypothetical protein